MVGRRGLSEVVGSLIVLVMISVAALTYASLYREASKGIEKAATAAVEAVDDRFSAPIMMPDVFNGDLVLLVIPVKPVKVEYVVLASNESIDVINVSKIIDTATTLALRRNYTCEPVFISLITDAGVILRYSPLRDPRVDWNSLSPEEAMVLEPGYVDCRILDILKSMGPATANQTAINGTVIYNGHEKYVALTADPPTYAVSVDPNDVYTVDYFNIIVNGVLSAGWASLAFQVLDSSGLLLGKARVDVSGPGSQASYLFSLPTSLGVVVPVYAKASCSLSSCVTGLFFESNGSVIVAGEATVVESVKYYLPVSQCPYSRLSFTLPMVLAPKANFTASTSGTCSIQWVIHVSLSGQASGSFETWGPLILAASTTANTNISLSINLWVRETVGVATLQSARLQLPVHGPMAYSLVPLNVAARDALTESILNFIEDGVDDVKLSIVADGLSALRPVTSSQQIIPLSSANYTIEAWLRAHTPFTAKLEVSYTSNQLASTVTYYKWNLTVKEAPLPDPRSLPILVKVESLEDSTRYLVLLPRATLTIEQGGSAYKGLAPLLGGAPATLSPVNSQLTFFILKASGSIASSLEVQASIFYDPAVDRVLEVDPLTGRFIAPSQQAVYLIVPVNQGADSKNQNTPLAAWIIVY